MIENYRPIVRKWTPTPRQAEILKFNQPTIDWLYSWTLPQLAEYAGKWIAARECQVIASAPTQAELTPLLAHLDRSTIIVHRIENRWMIRSPFTHRGDVLLRRVPDRI